MAQKMPCKSQKPSTLDAISEIDAIEILRVLIFSRQFVTGFVTRSAAEFVAAIQDSLVMRSCLFRCEVGCWIGGLRRRSSHRRPYEKSNGKRESAM